MEFNKPFAMMDSEEDKMITTESINEGYDIDPGKVWSAYDKLYYELGAEELLLNLAKNIGDENLSNALSNIARAFEIDLSGEFDADNLEADYEFDDDYTGVKPF